MRITRFQSTYSQPLIPGDLLRKTLDAVLRGGGMKLVLFPKPEPSYEIRYASNSFIWWTVLAVEDDYIEIISHYNYERGFVQYRDWDNFELITEQECHGQEIDQTDPAR